MKKKKKKKKSSNIMLLFNGDRPNGVLREYRKGMPRNRPETMVMDIASGKKKKKT